VDINADGKLDCVVGEEDGTIRLFLNTGTSSSAVFTEQASSANPFNGVNVGTAAI